MDEKTALFLKPKARSVFEKYWPTQKLNPDFLRHKRNSDNYRDRNVEQAWQCFWRGYKLCYDHMMEHASETFT